MSWAPERLADHCDTITKGTTPTSLGFNFADRGIPFVRVQNIVGGSVTFQNDDLFIDAITHQALKRSRIISGDLLLSIAGTIGRTAIVPEGVGDLNCNQAVAIIRPRPTIDRRFLMHWIGSQDAISQISQSKVTATIANLSLGQIGELKIPLPSLDEQKRIAGILDQADALRTKRKQALTRLNQLGQAIFVEMFGDLTKNEKCWPTLSIAQVCEEIVDCVNRTAPLSAEVTDYKMIRTTNVRSGRVDLNSVRYVDFDTFCRWNRRLKPRKGDVLLTREAPVGETGIIRSNDEVFLGQRLMLYRASPRLLTAEFLTYQFQSDFLRSQFSEHSSGSTVKHLSLPACRAFKFRVPPVELQKKFSEQLSAIIILEGYAEVCLGGLEDLFTSLQHRAFRGEL